MSAGTDELKNRERKTARILTVTGVTVNTKTPAGKRPRGHITSLGKNSNKRLYWT